MSVKISHIQIRNEESIRTHVAGEIIDGYIQFHVIIPCKIYGMTVGVHGTGKSKWVVDTDGKKHRVKGYEEYNTVCDLMRDGEKMMYDAGKYDIPFRIQLKEILPQSYDGSYSRIKYVVRAKLKTQGDGDRSSELLILKQDHRIRIQVIRDLNKMLDKKGLPFGGRKIKLDSAFKEEIGCWWSTLGKIVYQIYLLRQGFVRGEKIEMKMIVLNHTTVHSCYLHYSLEQHTMNINDNGALERSMTVIKPMAHLEGDMLLPSQEIEKTIVMRTSKEIPISGCRDSNVVDVSYIIKLQFEMFTETSGMKTTKRDLIIPVLIGDVSVDSSKWKHLEQQKKWAAPQKFYGEKRNTWECSERVRAKRFNRDALNKRGKKFLHFSQMIFPTAEEHN